MSNWIAAGFGVWGAWAGWAVAAEPWPSFVCEIEGSDGARWVTFEGSPDGFSLWYESRDADGRLESRRVVDRLLMEAWDFEGIPRAPHGTEALRMAAWGLASGGRSWSPAYVLTGQTWCPGVEGPCPAEASRRLRIEALDYRLPGKLWRFITTGCRAVVEKELPPSVTLLEAEERWAGMGDVCYVNSELRVTGNAVEGIAPCEADAEWADARMGNAFFGWYGDRRLTLRAQGVIETTLSEDLEGRCVRLLDRDGGELFRGVLKLPVPRREKPCAGYTP